MTTVKATDARANLYKLLDRAAESHEPIQITGKRSNAVLISGGGLAVDPGNPLSPFCSGHEGIDSQSP